MFQRLPDLAGTPVSFTLNGRPAEGREGDTVTAALLAAGVETCRSSAVGGEPRAPYCLMGVCFECLVTVDGIGNQQGCLVPLRPGMSVETQLGRGKRELSR